MAACAAPETTFAFVNSGSGGRKGPEALSILRRLLPPNNVFDLDADGGPGLGLDRISRLKSETDATVTILACGGDGTFSWIAAATTERFPPSETAAIRLVPVPLGSGNDMSRALGWGVKYPGARGLTRTIEVLPSLPTSPLDYWTVRYTDNHTQTPPGDKYRRATGFCNYLSFGLDADIELRFNEDRWSSPSSYTSQVGNMLAHAKLGALHTLRRRRIPLPHLITSLLVDDVPIRLPASTQALLLLNIPSYAAGAQPWRNPSPRSTSPTPRPAADASAVSRALSATSSASRASRASSSNASAFSSAAVDDGCLEVIGIDGVHHFVGSRVPGVGARRIAQGASVRVELCSGGEAGNGGGGDGGGGGDAGGVAMTPVQADGEPWKQCGGVIEVGHGGVVGVVCGVGHAQWRMNHARFVARAGGGHGRPAPGELDGVRRTV